MSTQSLHLKVRALALLVVAAVAAAACQPVSKTVVPQRPAATTAPTHAPASATSAGGAKPTTSAPATAAGTSAPTKAAPAAQPTTKATTSGAAQATAMPVPMGELQRAGGVEITALKAEQQPAIGSVKPAAGSHFEVVTVKITNTNATQPFLLNPGVFMLYDAASTSTLVSDAATKLTGVPDVLKSAEIQPKQSVTGTLVFEVPNNSSAKWELKYDANNARLLWSLSG